MRMSCLKRVSLVEDDMTRARRVSSTRKADSGDSHSHSIHRCDPQPLSFPSLLMTHISIIVIFLDRRVRVEHVDTADLLNSTFLLTVTECVSESG
jgi:hypothetical protein